MKRKSEALSNHTEKPEEQKKPKSTKKSKETISEVKEQTVEEDTKTKTGNKRRKVQG